jgi:D-sedoheptulose 7-phosphate isomerase
VTLKKQVKDFKDLRHFVQGYEPEEVLNLYLDEVTRVGVEHKDPRHLKEIVRFMVCIYNAWSDGKKIYVCGNGGSSANAQHFATDLIKLGVPVHCLNDNQSAMTMLVNDEGWDDVYTSQLNGFKNGDVLVCFSVHGGIGEAKAGKWSQNLIKAIDYARKAGGVVLGFVGGNGGAIRRMADVSIKVESNETPIIESYHSIFAHLIVEMLHQCRPVKFCSRCNAIRNSEVPECKCGEVEFNYAIGVVGNIEDWKKILNENQLKTFIDGDKKFTPLG